MKPETRKFLSRLAIAACGLAYATVILLSLSLPSPVVRPTPQEFEVTLLPRDARLLPDVDVAPEPEPFEDFREPLAELTPYVAELPPLAVIPLPPPDERPEELTPPAPRIEVPVVPGPLSPPKVEIAPHLRPAPGDVVLAMPAPRAVGDARRVLEWAAPDEELWVIARAATPAGPSDSQGGGEILATVPSEAREVPVPLKRTVAFAGISGYIATVTVKQRFQNPYEARIEAVYRFPLPHNAAINEFIITIGRRRIRGVIRERTEAERIYREARRQGLRSVLLSQERAAVFSHRVANIEPQEAIDVEIKYFHTLAYRDGWYEFVYPMVVRPRLTPSQGNEPEPQEPADERSGRDIALTVAIDAGLLIEGIVSPSHKITVRKRTEQQVRVKLRTARLIPNQDFVLRYRVAGEGLRSAMLFHRSKLGGFFTFMLHPPAELAALERQPIDLVLALDCSASMRGVPLVKAKLAVEQALKKLTPADAFQIIRFSDKVLQLGPQTVAATPANVQRALACLDGLEAAGGTLLNEGVGAALALPPARERLRFVVLLTDGYIANESDVLAEVERRIGEARVFSVGIGRAPHRYLLERMALLGRGAVAYIGPGDDPIEVMDRFVERATRPALTDISIDWGSMRVAEVYPRRVPDVFYGRPVVLTGRFRAKGAATIRIRGRVGGTPREFRLRVDPGDGGPVHTAIPPIWARARIADLACQIGAQGTPVLPREIARLALQHNLLTPLTRFIAIDTLRRTRRRRAPTFRTQDLVPQSLSFRRTIYRP